MPEMKTKRGLHPATLYLIWAAFLIAIVVIALALEYPALSATFGYNLDISDGWAEYSWLERAFFFLRYANGLAGGLGVEQAAAGLTITLLLAVARHVGLLAAIADGWCRNVSVPMIPASVALVGITGGIIGIYWQFFFLPVAAYVFQRARLHPVAGIMVAFVSGCAAHAAGLLLPGGASQFLPAWFEVNSPDTSLLVFHSAYMIYAILVPFTVIGFAWMCWRRTVPTLIRISGGTLPEDEALPAAAPADSRRGGRAVALLVFLVIATLVMLTVKPGTGFRMEGSGSTQPLLNVLPTTFMATLVALIFIFGIRARTLRSDDDVWSPMIAAGPELGRLVVMTFAVGALIIATSLVNWPWLAESIILGASEAADGGLYGMAFLLFFVIFCITFASPVWALTGTYAISVMQVFTGLGVSTMVPQTIILMATAAATMVSPASLVLVYGWLVARRFMPELKLGQFIAGLVPYALIFALLSLGMAAIWYALGLPVLAGEPFQ
ncbi:MAG TPA: AbgT family transporter [Micropepsaceae bacterium]|nr:AbgT family transporter [Micropepsaceae bacterium]